MDTLKGERRFNLHLAEEKLPDLFNNIKAYKQVTKEKVNSNWQASFSHSFIHF